MIETTHTTPSLARSSDSGNNRLQGTFTALVTPFYPSTNEVDYNAFDTLLERQLNSGINGVVPCGTTGESPTLGDDEKLRIIEHTCKRARGRAMVIAGTGTNSTSHSIRASLAAVQAGADGVMVVMPYYNKPSQQGLMDHIKEVAHAIAPAPILLYNIPARTAVDLSNDTLARVLDACPNVAAVKDATGNVLRCQQLVARFGNRIAVMCGDDVLTLAMMSVGARGVISVSSNVFPKEVSDVCKAALQGCWEIARKLHFELLSVHEAMFIEPNPGPVKAALAAMNLLPLHVRLPLSIPTDSSIQLITKAIQTYQEHTQK